MTNKIKNAFDNIHAEDSLKTNTILYIQKEVQKRNKTYRRILANRFTAVMLSLAVIIISGAFSYNLYFTASAYVDLDINPSIELTINRFDRIIDVYAYNSDGQDILSGLSLKHMKYENALKELINTVTQNGFLHNDGLISVTLLTNNTSRESELLSHIQMGIEAAVAEHHAAAQIDVFSVDNDTRIHAHEQNISPAKYLAIIELMEVDPNTTFEHCKDHSIGEIMRLTKEHTENHHRGWNNGTEHGNGGNNCHNTGH